jgi:uncharacterized membrane protein
MDIFVLVSKLLGIYLVVSGLFLILKAKTVPLLLKDFFDHPAIVFLTGVILIFLSSMFLIQHNVWNGSWKTIVTAFAWLVLLKGLAYIFAPGALSEMSIRKFRGWFGAWGILAIIIGVYLFYLG